jgi:putative DNA primase/helicase
VVAGNSEPRQIKKAVLDFVERDSARFERLDDNVVGYFGEGTRPHFVTHDRAGWIKSEGVYLFTTGGFKEATKGFDRDSALEVLGAAGAIQPKQDSKGKPCWHHVKKIPGHGTARVYEIDASKL